jgi:hypothetical protein
MKTPTRILRTASIFCALAWAAGGANGATNPASLTLSVTIGVNLSVRIRADSGSDLANYDFGALALGQASVNTGNINIDNDSGGLMESFQLSVENRDAALTLKTNSNPLGLNEYRLSALFQDAAPPPGLFGSDDILTASAQTAQDASGGRFAAGGTPATQDGAAVLDDGRLPVGEVRLWLKLELPPSATVNGLRQNFATVFVNAL